MNPQQLQEIELQEARVEYVSNTDGSAEIVHVWVEVLGVEMDVRHLLSNDQEILVFESIDEGNSNG